jgi:hypothetical protein
VCLIFKILSENVMSNSSCMVALSNVNVCSCCEFDQPLVVNESNKNEVEWITYAVT